MYSTSDNVDEWIGMLRSALELEESVPIHFMLDLTREVAHGVARPAGPLTTYLAGLAVAHGKAPEDVAATVRVELERWRSVGRS